MMPDVFSKQSGDTIPRLARSYGATREIVSPDCKKMTDFLRKDCGGLFFLQTTARGGKHHTPDGSDVPNGLRLRAS